jgi:hypothetical protein
MKRATNQVYPLDMKFYYPPKPSKSLIPSQGSHRQSLDATLNAQDSPMINALTKKTSVDFSSPNIREKSIYKRETIIYWISYLQKKLLQQERQIICQEKNSQQPGKYEAYERDFPVILRKRCNLHANEVADLKREQMMKAKGLLP